MKNGGVVKAARPRGHEAVILRGPEVTRPRGLWCWCSGMMRPGLLAAVVSFPGHDDVAFVRGAGPENG